MEWHVRACCQKQNQAGTQRRKRWGHSVGVSRINQSHSRVWHVGYRATPRFSNTLLHAELSADWMQDSGEGEWTARLWRGGKSAFLHFASLDEQLKYIFFFHFCAGSWPFFSLLRSLNKYFFFSVRYFFVLVFFFFSLSCSLYSILTLLENYGGGKKMHFWILTSTNSPEASRFPDGASFPR